MIDRETETFWSRTSVKAFVAVVGAFSLVAVLTAVVAVAVAANSSSASGGTASGNSVQLVDPNAQKIDFNAKPPGTFKPRDPNAPPSPTTPPGTVHKLTMTAREIQMEIAPGVKQEMWTFDNLVPGPTLRGKVGDRFEITLVNASDAKNGHSIDFHASKVAWNVEMRTIKPGESLQYNFDANYAGVYMYHCGTSPTLHHIGNGMYGAIIVDPPDLAPVDREFVFVQSELYTAAPGQVASYEKMLAEQWDAVVFNGYPNQYATHPIRVEPGQRVRVWVMDDGPSENSSFHIVGTIFDTVFKEGHYLLQPGNPQQGGSQALDLQPAQGGFVEFTLDPAGLYPFVTHKFSNPPKGATGIFQSGDVESTGAGH